MKNLKNENAFTLIEVVASLVIITIVILGFSQVFFQSSKIAKYNNEKLVLINLADVELERLQATPQADFAPILSDLNNTLKNNQYTKTVILNDRNYSVVIKEAMSPFVPGNEMVIQNTGLTEADLQLINLKVEVISLDSKTEPSSVSEGYIRKQ